MVALITGIANKESLSYAVLLGVPEDEHVIATYLDEKTKKYAKEAVTACGVDMYLPLDVRNAEQMAAVVEAARALGGLDFVLHSMAFARAADLNGRVIDCSLEGLQEAVDISCHSLCRLVKAVEPVLKRGASVVTLSYLGGERVVPGYGMMGPCKAMLESMVRWIAYELGPKEVTVNAVSPGPLATRAASGITDFGSIEQRAVASAPGLFSKYDVCAAVNMLRHAKGINGQVIYVDGGHSIMAA